MPSKYLAFFFFTVFLYGFVFSCQEDEASHAKYLSGILSIESPINMNNTKITYIVNKSTSEYLLVRSIQIFPSDTWKIVSPNLPLPSNGLKINPQEKYSLQVELIKDIQVECYQTIDEIVRHAPEGCQQILHTNPCGKVLIISDASREDGYNGCSIFDIFKE